VLRDFYKLENFKQLNCLDIGCAGGIITSFLAEEFNLVIGLDTDTDALKAAVNSYNHDNILYEKGNGIRLPFASKQFDVVVCNHIYEHVPSSSKLLKEIKRVLKDDGVCYFSAGNRCWPIEPHYKIPFLSWLPRNIANRYLQITGK
jgi:2-polyprenyl-3-methyl-5-hydroxy-6-metoxy-1,4-benzoquinol methylase